MNATTKNERLTVEIDLHPQRRGRGGLKVLVEGPAPMAVPAGRTPRVSKLMALALSIEGRVASGAIENYSEAARAGKVTRARISQIIALTCLAPDIVETILHLPRTTAGKDPVLMRDLLPIAQQLDWKVQRLMWRELLRDAGMEPAR